MLRIEVGGSSTISEDGYIEGAPELVAEIATCSAVLDLGAKKNAYRRNGVQEYLVWQTFENHLSWFRLQNEEFISIEPDVEGIIRSSIFPGLWLDVPALLADTMMDVLNILQAGIADSAHEAFVQSLVNRASG